MEAHRGKTIGEDDADLLIEDAQTENGTENGDRKRCRIPFYEDFINEVEAKRGSMISQDDADLLIGDAQGIIDLFE